MTDTQNLPVAWRWCHRNEVLPRLWNYTEQPMESTELVLVEPLCVARCLEQTLGKN